MGSAQLAKIRMSRKPLSFHEWSKRVNLLLAVGDLSTEKLPQYRLRFKSWYLAGISSGEVAVTILRSHGAPAVKDAVKGND